MPTIHRERGYRFYFNSNENNEPPHIHVRGEKGRMKVWLLSLNITSCRGIRDHEQTKLLEIVEINQKRFLCEWQEFRKRETEK